MRKSFLAVFLLLVTTFISCNKNNGNEIVHMTISDSTFINLIEYETKSILVGESISNKPLCSQIALINDKEKYLMMDNGYIYIFDWESGMLEDSITTESCGKLNNYSGFRYASEDSIYIYNYQTNRFFIISSNGEIIKQVKILENENPVENAHICALNITPIYHCDSMFLLSGYMPGGLSMAKGMKIPASTMLDIESGRNKPIAYYPDLYTEHNWGTIYMNTVGITTDNKRNILYSFAITPHVYKYNADFTKCDTFYMQTRYDKGTKPAMNSIDELENNVEHEIKYYTSHTTYAEILYDTYRNCYIRVAEHPMMWKSAKESFAKPISLITANDKGEVISETAIIKRGTTLITNNMHICRAGLAIAKESGDENIILFNCYKIGDI